MLQKISLLAVILQSLTSSCPDSTFNSILTSIIGNIAVPVNVLPTNVFTCDFDMTVFIKNVLEGKDSNLEETYLKG